MFFHSVFGRFWDVFFGKNVLKTDVFFTSIFINNKFKIYKSKGYEPAMTIKVRVRVRVMAIPNPNPNLLHRSRLISLRNSEIVNLKNFTMSKGYEPAMIIKVRVRVIANPNPNPNPLS